MGRWTQTLRDLALGSALIARVADAGVVFSDDFEMRLGSDLAAERKRLAALTDLRGQWRIRLLGRIELVMRRCFAEYREGEDQLLALYALVLPTQCKR